MAFLVSDRRQLLPIPVQQHRLRSSPYHYARVVLKDPRSSPDRRFSDESFFHFTQSSDFVQ
jgi:hypothetical protein